jgi:heme oxygenase
MKDLIKEKHKEAENTLFMQTVFQNKMSEEMWADFIYNKAVWYKAIENKAKEEGVLKDLPGIERYSLLMNDYENSNKYGNPPEIKKTTSEYFDYIMDLSVGKVIAHLYTWYMGDLSGGSMIKKIIKAPHSSLEFDNPEELKKKILLKISKDDIQEVNNAFDWAIKIMKEYDKELING